MSSRIIYLLTVRDVGDHVHQGDLADRAEDPGGRGIEYEYDILLVGTTADAPRPDPAEVAAWEWVELEALRRDMKARPERYAPWFHRGLPLVAPG